MSHPHHSLEDLFAQLGLQSDPDAIERFITQHRPLPNEVALYRATIWSPAQRAFLKEEIIGDGEWALAIDELNRRLH
jgi:predicted Zn-dependent protease with MMP-like domain